MLLFELECLSKYSKNKKWVDRIDLLSIPANFVQKTVLKLRSMSIHCEVGEHDDLVEDGRNIKI